MLDVVLCYHFSVKESGKEVERKWEGGGEKVGERWREREREKERKWEGGREKVGERTCTI